MKKLWLLFSQVVTVALALSLVALAVQPRWLRVLLPAVPQAAIPTTPEVVLPQAETLRNAARAAAPAVVSIIVHHDEDDEASGHASASSPEAAAGDEGEDWFSGVGSGVIMDTTGYILTNNHVVADASAIDVQLADSRKARAAVIGTDPDTDLAVLKIDLPHLPAITLGDMASLQVGDAVLAIGDPFGVGQTVTSGIVSAMGRSQLGINTFEDFIQTDAAINPGNSGGALVNIHGQLVGINTAMYSRTGSYMGIGFATPVNIARQVLEGIVQHGHVTRGWIGVEPTNITPELASLFHMDADTQGVMVTGLVQDGPAASAGMQLGDVIHAVNRTPVRNVHGLLATVSALPPGQAIPLEIVRAGDSIALRVTPRQRPSAAPRIHTPPESSEAHKF